MLTLAVGIGANTAVFTFVDALLLRPLAGVQEPGRLVQVGRQYISRAFPSDSTYPDYLDYRDRNTVLSGLAAASPRAFHLRAGSDTERVEGELVSANYFDVLGVTPALGRLLSPADESDARGGSLVVVSHRLWQRRFGGEPAMAGRTIELDGHAFTVIGVAHEAFAGTKIGSRRDVWVPLVSLPQIDPAAVWFNQRRALVARVVRTVEAWGHRRAGARRADADCRTARSRLPGHEQDRRGSASSPASDATSPCRPRFAASRMCRSSPSRSCC